ncbi:MAG TPA: O-antigen ligase family protein [Azospirillaceae bacterium]|nr:O-antigen ligase family protein [Azospirillaceae bacterium]
MSNSPSTLVAARAAPRPFPAKLAAIVAALAVVGLAAAPEPLTALAVMAGIVFAFAALYRPELGLVALIFLVHTNLAYVMETYHGVADVGRLMITFVGWVVLVRFLVLRERPALNVAGLAPVAATFLVSGLSLFHATDTVVALDLLEALAKDILLLVVLMLLLTDVRRFHLVAWTWIGAGILLGSLVAFQYFTGAFGDLFYGFGHATVEHIAGKVNSWRLSGPLPDPNYFAQVMLFVVPLAMDRLAHGRRRPLRLIALWGVVACLLAIMFTFSRGALLSLGLYFALLVWMRRPSPKLVGVMAVAGLAVVAVMPAEYHDRMSSLVDTLLSLGSGNGSTDPAVAGRLGEMMGAWYMFADNPLLGVGIGHYPLSFQQVTLDHGLMLRGADRSAHSLYMQTAAEKGVIGLAVLFWLLATVAGNVIRTWRALRAAGDVGSARLVAAFGLGFLAFMVASAFLHDAFSRYFWSIVGIGLALPQIAPVRPSAPVSASAPWHPSSPCRRR